MEENKTNNLFNRGNNMAIVLFIAAVGLGVIGDVIIEKEWIDRADDIFIVIIAIIAIIWYFSGDNKYKLSVMPFVLSSLAFLAKVSAILIEFDDKDAVGDDFGLVIPLLLIVIMSITLYSKAKKRIRN